METIIDSSIVQSDTNQIIDSISTLIYSGKAEILDTLNEIGSDKILGLPSNWFFLIAGALAGLIIVILYRELTFLIRLFKYKYYSYNGYYLAFQKYDKTKEDYFIKLTRNKNQFKVNGVSIKKVESKYEKRNEPFTGMIVLSETMPIYGNGYYQHKIDNDGKTRFGFYSIQLSKDSILVSHTINNLDNTLVNPAYIWKKINAEDYPELIKFYKEQQK